MSARPALPPRRTNLPTRAPRPIPADRMRLALRPSIRALRRLALAVLLLLAAASTRASAQPQAATAAAPQPFAVEYYYKVRWGHFEEFMDLYRRNHWPILQRQQRMGRIVSMSVAYPVNHAGETDRWDMRFTIVWRDAATAHDDFDPSAIVRELYPDRARFRAEEQRRFELLLSHTDVPVRVEDPATWRP